MKTRILAIMAVLAMVLVLFAGCNGTNQPGGKDSDATNTNKPQLVVAMNPILVYDDSTSVVAFNEINTAMKADNETSSLTAMYQDTAWQWVYATADGWKQRATYNLGKWANGAGTAVKKTAAYTFNENGDISLSRFTAGSPELTAYNGDATPEVGLLLSVTGSEREALCYTVEQDGLLAIPTGSITAIAEVAGVKTGFLAEDGTPRSAALSILINNKQIWSGTLTNTTASLDGQAVTTLEYPQLDSLKVTAGDKVFFTLKLDAQANRDEDVSKPDYDESLYWRTTRRTERVPVGYASESSGQKSAVVNKDGSINLIADYEFVFTLVRDAEYKDGLLVSMAGTMATELMNNTGAVITVAKSNADEAEYEIVVGPYAARPESIKIYNELINYRADNASDFIIRLVGKKLYIVGANDIALQEAVDYFMEKFGQDDEGRISANYNYVNRLAHQTYLINGRNVASYTIRVEKYPSYMVQMAAEDFQTLIREKAGYSVPIKHLTDALTHDPYEIQIGPMKGSVKVQRTYDTAFTVANDSVYSTIQTDGLLDCADSHYDAKLVGNNLVINGGTTYAVNAGAQVVLADLAATRSLAAGYARSGDYTSQFDWVNKAEYATVNYALSGGYGLVYNEEFSMVGDHSATEADLRSRWTISSDSSSAPLTDGGKQFRPGVYGQNWWVQEDATGNGYLLEVTKKVSGGFDAGRLVSENKWGFRYGIWETRLVMGTRNGACSAVWAMTGNPVKQKPRFEIDVYENFGKDSFHPDLHTWDTTLDEAVKEADGTTHIDHWGTDVERTVITPSTGEHFYDTFHNIGVIWTSTYIYFFFDGQIYNKVSTTAKRMEAARAPITIKLANGVGTATYSVGYDPIDFVVGGAQDNGLESVDKFFEVQYVDYTRIYQVSTAGLKARDASQFTVSKKMGK